MLKSINVFLNKKDYQKKALCSAAVFETDPFLEMTVPSNCNLKTGFLIVVKFAETLCEFTVVELISKVTTTTTTSKIKFRASRKIISNDN